MKYEKLRTSQIKSVRALLLKKQNNTCPLCEGKIGTARSKKRPALDHDHTTGIIRDVLCINCNGMEGKIWNLLRRMKKGEARNILVKLLEYYERHDHMPHGPILHPTHLNDAEKRDRRNLKQRKKRAEAKRNK